MELGRFGQDSGEPEPETEEELLDLLRRMVEDFTDKNAQIIQFRRRDEGTDKQDHPEER